jgi:NADPH2:quinone reductase
MEVSMKAIQAADRGGYDALRLVDIPRPQSRAGQALVRVTSAGVTPLDRTVLAGLHPTARKLPLVPGNEGAGVVIEDPSGRFPAGERVLFFAGPGGVAQDGTFAEIASVPSGNLAPLPGGIPDEIAGGLPVAYLSAFLALRQAGFREGQSVSGPRRGRERRERHPEGGPGPRGVAAGVDGRKRGEGGRRCRWRTARRRHRQSPAREPP